MNAAIALAVLATIVVAIVVTVFSFRHRHRVEVFACSHCGTRRFDSVDRHGDIEHRRYEYPADGSRQIRCRLVLSHAWELAS